MDASHHHSLVNITNLKKAVRLHRRQVRRRETLNTQRTFCGALHWREYVSHQEHARSSTCGPVRIRVVCGACDSDHTNRDKVRTTNIAKNSVDRQWEIDEALQRTATSMRDDIHSISSLQAQCFYERIKGPSIGPFSIGMPDFVDNAFQKFFEADIRGALRVKTFSPRGRFACIVARSSAKGLGGIADYTNTDDNRKDEYSSEIIGVAEVSWQNDAEIIEILGHAGTAEDTNGFYPYLSCMAVNPTWRRKGIASSLISNSERIATEWGFKYIALHVYLKNSEARELYTRCGYKVVAVDPWFKFSGDRQRELRVKML